LIEDVYEPLARYRDEFCQKFATLVREKFKELTSKAGVDVEANRALVKVIKALQAKADSADFKATCFGWLIALSIVGALVALGVAVFTNDYDPKTSCWCIVGFIAGAVFCLWMISLYRNASKLADKLKEQISRKKFAAWQQMNPLNQLYTWDITVKLIEATVPRLEFDPYFAADRLASLYDQYGWSDSFNREKSMIYAQSGVINGNPFVFGHYLDMEWDGKKYEGTKEISWTEWEMDEKGRERLVRRHETLHAYVIKPIPVYSEHKFLVYGNDAAPKLSFSREPSGLTGTEDDLFSAIRKKWRLSRLKAFSRNLDDASNFTLMSNHEFETWFHAKDRDNEVEFRVLFTPVAQTQMLNLMKDTEVGYGDDFTFLKNKKINLLTSSHLDAATLDTNPLKFHNWDYDAAAEFFISFNERYFKDVYFSLAPLLSIPIYQQTRTHEDIWKGVVGNVPSSFWEHEAIANFYGAINFTHPSCVTRNILKTRVLSREDGVSTIEVTAYGYRGVERVHHESVYGSDGNWHDVPVPWTEYLPVQNKRTMYICEGDAPPEAFRSRADASIKRALRRSILSYLDKI